jgi:large subunit ribosomal protein L15
MRLHELKPAPGSKRDRKRLGRGTGSGQGTTAGKGTKGEKARSGGLRAGFRGMSSRNARLPKRRGFNNQFKIEYRPINLDRLTRFDSGATVGIDQLVQAGLVDRSHPYAKVLGGGTIEIPLHLVGVRVSASARRQIEAAGGTVTIDGDEGPESSGPEEAASAAASPAAVVPVPTTAEPMTEQAEASAPAPETEEEAPGDTSSV